MIIRQEVIRNVDIWGIGRRFTGSQGSFQEIVQMDAFVFNKVECRVDNVMPLDHAGLWVQIESR